MQIIIETPRLFLRQFTPADAEIMFELNHDPEITRYVHEPPIENAQQALDILNNIILPQYNLKLGRWAAHLRENGAFVGWCGLKYLPEPDVIDLGYRFMKKYWGMGFATETASHTLEYGFKVLGLDLITAHAHVQNHASIRVIEKLGMRFIGEKIEDDCPVRMYQSANPYRD